MLISLSALAKNARVICKIDDDEWYAGTIIRVARDGSKVTFEANDGETYHIDGDDLNNVHPISVAGKKGKYTNVQAKSLLSPTKKPPVKPTTVSEIPYKKGDKVIVAFDDGLTGPTVVAAIDKKEGKVGVWRGRGNLVWVDAANVKPKSVEVAEFNETEKPVETFKPVVVEKLWADELFNKEFDPHYIPEDLYNKSKCLGIMFRTGRTGPTSQGIILGVGHDRKHNSVAHIWTPHTDERQRFLTARLTSTNSHTDGDLAERFRIVGPKIEYKQFIKYREHLASFLSSYKERVEHNAKKDDETANKFNIDSRIVGKQVTIRWDRGEPSTELVKGYKDGKVGIQGSRTKLRWIPVRYIVGVQP